MTIPCCHPDPGSGGRPYRCEDVRDVAACLDSDPRGIPGPAGTLCLDTSGPEDVGCFTCNPEAGEQIPGWPCCYEGNVFYNNPSVSWESSCTRCGGRGPVSPEDCEIEPPPPDCVGPQEDRLPTDGRRWTIDLLGTVALALSDTPGDGGIVELMTDHLTRPTPALSEREPCVHLEAREVMLEDGLVYAEVCSAPDGDDSRRVSYAGLMTVMDQPRLQEGNQYNVASIQLPPWTEAILRSEQWRCKGIPV